MRIVNLNCAMYKPKQSVLISGNHQKSLDLLVITSEKILVIGLALKTSGSMKMSELHIAVGLVQKVLYET